MNTLSKHNNEEKRNVICLQIYFQPYKLETIQKFSPENHRINRKNSLYMK